MEINTSTSKKSSLKGFFSKENLPLLFLIIFGVFAVVSIIVSIALLQIPVVTVCLMVILETVLVVCLNRIPLWLHGIIFIAQIIAGILAGHVAFMVLMAFVYVIAVVFLFIWAHHE